SASLTGVSGDASVDAFAGEQGSVTGNAGWSQFGGTGTVHELGGVDANGDVNGEFGLSGVDASASASAFAGAEADASGTANVGPASASGSVDVSAHKIGFSWNVGVTLGLGGDIGGSVSVDPSKVISDVNKVMP